MKIRHFYLAALTAAVLAGCSDDEAVPNTPDLTDTPILVNTGVNNLVTRAGYDKGELAEGSFGLYLTTEGTAANETRYNCENKKVSHNGTQWAYDDTPLYWKSNEASVTYYAYMPYGETAPTTLTVSKMQSGDTFKAEDFLYAESATTTATEKGIGITFNHKLSKLDITLARGTELEGDVAFESVVLEGCCATSADFDISTGTVTPAATDGTESVTTLPGGTTDAYECLLVPQTMSQLAVTITATVGGETKYYKYTSSGEQQFRSGYRYTLPLTVGRDRVEPGKITAEPWENAGETGNLETE